MKQSSLIVGLLVVTAVSLTGYMATQAFSQRSSEPGIAATLYKSPTCGCCGSYASHLSRKGYDMDVRETQNITAIKEQYDIPYELESCHTTHIGDYVVEGHIPEEAIQKLLIEKPDIKGIGMAGMPSGSPGMPGPKTQDFVIYEIAHDGTKGDVFTTI